MGEDTLLLDFAMRSVIKAIAALTLTFAAASAVAEAQPVSVDTTMEELLGDDRTGLLLAADKLDLSKLDYSLESLKEIDAWLEAVHVRNFAEAGPGRAGETLMSDGRGRNTVTLAGLYLGETVRRNSNLGWAWVPFDEFIAQNPAYAAYYGPDAGLDAYVLVGEQGAATPINSALKRVLNGGQDSIAYIGAFLVTPIDFDRAVEGYDPGPDPKIVARQMDDVDPAAGTADIVDEADQLLEAIRDAKASLKATSL